VVYIFWLDGIFSGYRSGHTINELNKCWEPQLSFKLQQVLNTRYSRKESDLPRSNDSVKQNKPAELTIEHVISVSSP